MKPFLIFLAILCLWSLPVKAADFTTDIEKAEEYLRTLDTARAQFIQRSNNGGQLSGTFYLNRPGRLRFEYNEIDDFIVADGVLIYFYDAELQEQSHAPIGSSLANFLLRSDLRLSGDITVQDVTKRRGYTAVKLVQTGDPEAGTLELVFSNKPYELSKWRVIDAQGIITDIELNDLERDLDLPNHLFGYIKPKDPKKLFNE